MLRKLSKNETLRILCEAKPVSPSGLDISLSGLATRLDIYSDRFAGNDYLFGELIGNLAQWCYLVEYEGYAIFEFKCAEIKESAIGFSLKNTFFNLRELIETPVFGDNGVSHYLLDKESDCSLLQDEQKSIRVYFGKLKARINREIKKYGNSNIYPITDVYGFSDYLYPSDISKFSEKTGLKITTLNLYGKFDLIPLVDSPPIPIEDTAVAYYQGLGYHASACEGASLYFAITAIFYCAIFNLRQDLQGYFINIIRRFGCEQLLESDDFKSMNDFDRIVNYGFNFQMELFDLFDQDVSIFSRNKKNDKSGGKYGFFVAEVENVFKAKNWQMALGVYHRIKHRFVRLRYGKVADDWFVEKLLKLVDWQDLYILFSHNSKKFRFMSTQSSWPDITVISKDGSLRLIEVKSEGDRLSEGQRKFIVQNSKHLSSVFELMLIIRR